MIRIQELLLYVTNTQINLKRKHIYFHVTFSDNHLMLFFQIPKNDAEYIYCS